MPRFSRRANTSRARCSSSSARCNRMLSGGVIFVCPCGKIRCWLSDGQANDGQPTLAKGAIIAAVAGTSVLDQIEHWTLLRPCNLDTHNSSLKFRPCRWVGFRELLVYLVMRRYSSLLFDGHQAFVDELIHTDRAELTAVTRAFHAAEGHF